MNRQWASRILFILCLWIVLPSSATADQALWKRIDEGLSVGEFDRPEKSGRSDAHITVVRIDPKFYSFRLLSASEHGRTRMTPKQWCENHVLAAAINAGMYQKDGITSVGYMKNFSHVNNPRLAASYKAVLAFNPVEPALPEIQIIDLRCEDFQRLRPKYQTFIQSIRMISCQQENVWSPQDKAYGMAVFGMDKDGNALFIFGESPYSGYDFINILLSLPLSIYNAMYLEGGPEASLFFSTKELHFERVGRYSLDGGRDAFAAARPVPNVIGIVKKSK